MIKITQDEINKLIEDNIKLAYAVFWKYYPIVRNNIEIDDGISMCFEGLIQAANTYNSSKGYTFSTYAFIVIKNTLLLNLRNSKTKFDTVSLNTPVQGKDGECDISYFIPDSFNLEETVENKILNEILYECINELTERDKRILLLFMQKIPQRRIGEMVGVHQAQVSRSIKRIINILRNKLKQRGVE